MPLSHKIFFFFTKKWYTVQKGENCCGSEPKATEISKSTSIDLS